jgi:hypothetical protein
MLDPESLTPEQPLQYLDLSNYPDFETRVLSWKISGLMIKQEVYTP